MKRFLLLMLALFTIGGCKQKQQISANTRTLGKPRPNANPMPPKPVADAPEVAKMEQPASTPAPVPTDSNQVRLVISFYSIGMGSDFKSIQAYEDFIGVFAGEVKKTINYEKTAWGREGETDFCLGLQELTQAEQDQFIARSREKLRDAKWVNLYENSPCRHRRAK
jgi:hypothetical protein